MGIRIETHSDRRISPLANKGAFATPTLQKSDLGPGDVLLLHIGENNVLPWRPPIMHGQRICDAVRPKAMRGDHRLIHALVWLKDARQALKAGAADPQGPETVETRAAISGGKRRWQFELGDAARGVYKVYAPLDAELGAAAAATARQWSQSRSGCMHVSIAKMLKTIVRSPAYRRHAERRTTVYAAQRHDEHPTWARNGIFCSEFIVAAYQSAAYSSGRSIQGALAIDAKATRPATLDNALARDPEHFRLKGYIAI